MCFDGPKKLMWFDGPKSSFSPFKTFFVLMDPLRTYYCHLVPLYFFFLLINLGWWPFLALIYRVICKVRHGYLLNRNDCRLKNILYPINNEPSKDYLILLDWNTIPKLPFGRLWSYKSKVFTFRVFLPRIQTGSVWEWQFLCEICSSQMSQILFICHGILGWWPESSSRYSSLNYRAIRNYPTISSNNF